MKNGRKRHVIWAIKKKLLKKKTYYRIYLYLNVILNKCMYELYAYVLAIGIASATKRTEQRN